MPLLNYWGNRLFAWLFTWILGQRFTDTLSGVKALSKKRYKQLERERGIFGNFDPFGDFEFIFWAMKNNLKLAEVPITYVSRPYGETKTKTFKHGLLLLKITLKGIYLFKLRV